MPAVTDLGGLGDVAPLLAILEHAKMDVLLLKHTNSCK